MNNVLPDRNLVQCGFVFEEAMILKKLFVLLNQINKNSNIPIIFSSNKIEGKVNRKNNVKNSKQNIGSVYGNFVINADDLPLYINKKDKDSNYSINLSDLVSAFTQVKKKQFVSFYELKNDHQFYYNLNGISSTIPLTIGKNLTNDENGFADIFKSDVCPDAKLPITYFNDYCGQCRAYSSGVLKIDSYTDGVKFTALAYGESRDREILYGDINTELKDTMYINIDSILIFYNAITIIAPSGSVIKFYISKSQKDNGYLKICFQIGGVGVCKLFIEGIEYKESNNI